VKRVFSSTAPNQLWVTDLTFVPTWAGVAYVCFIIDAYSRTIVGWRVASNMKTETVLDAIEMARWSRGKHLPGLRCHSDRLNLDNSRLFAMGSVSQRSALFHRLGPMVIPLITPWLTP
jgi:transposase InsO family protein